MSQAICSVAQIMSSGNYYRPMNLGYGQKYFFNNFFIKCELWIKFIDHEFEVQKFVKI